MAVVLLAVILVGCQNTSPQRISQVRKELADVQDDNKQLRDKLALSEQTVQSQLQQIQNLTEFPLGKARLESLVTTDRIELDRLTGGYDKNQDGYDDGIVVYLQPIDVDGHVIKSTGKITVRLFDLNAPEARLLGETAVSPLESRKLWYGQAWTHHFTIHCPFESRPRQSPVTVQVVFVELLTGREFKAQRSCEVKIEPPVATTTAETAPTTRRSQD